MWEFAEPLLTIGLTAPINSRAVIRNEESRMAISLTPQNMLYNNSSQTRGQKANRHSQTSWSECLQYS